MSTKPVNKNIYCHSVIKHGKDRTKLSCWKLALAVGVAVTGFFFWSANPAPSIVDIDRNQIPASPLAFSCETPSWLSPYKGNDRVQFPRVKTQLQERLIMRTGCVYLNGEPRGYQIQNRDLQNSHESYLTEIDRSDQFLSSHSTSNIKSIREKIKTNFRSPGAVGAHDPKGVLVAVNRNAPAQHIKADVHLGTWISEIPLLSPDEIVQRLVQSHDLLIQGSKDIPLGLRETTGMVFTNTTSENTAEGLTQLVKAKGTKEDVKFFQTRIFPKFHAAAPGWPERNQFTSKELKVIEYIGYLTPRASEVPQLLRQFANELKESYLQMTHCRSQFDPIAFASWAHGKLVEIHPFYDGSGRTARLLMNNILKIAGHQPIVFPSKNEYTEAIIKDKKTPGYFSRFLKESVISWNEAQFGPNSRCLRRFNC